VGIGTAIRQRFGPYEHTVAEAYRARFINLDDFARTVASIVDPDRIAEIGCGDGAVAERMCREFPAAHYTGIDIAPEPGRLFRGDPAQAQFQSISSSELLAQAPPPFDLVMLVDVFHHLPADLRVPTIRDMDSLCRPGGTIVIKDWARAFNPAHLASYTADRYISGDRQTHYASRTELRAAIQAGIAQAHLVCEARIPPRRNNIMFGLRKPLDLEQRA
jgi:2-polyprenyl-6-hydroxyphenyl methylase/3-demethylubiquinone-9 3-methyltransferase